MTTAPEPAGSTRSVYALLDPATGLTRYVGQAADPAARVQRHWQNRTASSLLATWLCTLDEPPPVEVIEVVPATEALGAEAAEIRRLRRSTGARLLNLRPYEDLTDLPGVDPAAVERLAVLRQHWAAIHRDRGHRPGQPMSAEARARISDAMRGHSVSAEARARMSAAGRGRPKSPEHRARISAGVTAWHADRRRSLAEAS